MIGFAAKVQELINIPDTLNGWKKHGVTKGIEMHTTKISKLLLYPASWIVTLLMYIHNSIRVTVLFLKPKYVIVKDFFWLIVAANFWLVGYIWIIIERKFGTKSPIEFWLQKNYKGKK